MIWGYHYFWKHPFIGIFPGKLQQIFGYFGGMEFKFEGYLTISMFFFKCWGAHGGPWQKKDDLARSMSVLIQMIVPIINFQC